VTGREIEERVAKIKNELPKNFQHFTVKVLGIWAHRGNVEKYFKHRYAGDNFTVGSLIPFF
jgi:hypothetical protein